MKKYADISSLYGDVSHKICFLKRIRFRLLLANLYGGWQGVCDYVKEVLDRVLCSDDLEQLFVSLSEDEAEAKEALAEMSVKYPSVIKQDNVNDIIAALKAKKHKNDEKNET